MKVLICGGGTGGHVYPALATVAELAATGVEQEDVLWIGTHGQMEEKLVPRAGLRLRTIPGGPIVGVASLTRLRNGGRLAWSIGSAGRIIASFRPDVLFLTGGYVNVPVAIAARLRRVPTAVYLPDVEPGTAIKMMMRLRLVDRIAVTTADSARFVAPVPMTVTGYPVRPSLRAANVLSRSEALATFDLTPGRPTLFVFGGSRGAWRINEALLGSLDQLLERVQIIHISGTLTWPQVNAFAAQLPPTQRAFYRPYPYLHERMGAAFRAADLAVARAGASMLGEGPAFGLPAILVPLTFAWRYQKVNANFLESRGAAIHLRDETLDETLAPTVLALLAESGRLAAMSAAAASLDIPDSAARLARLLVTLGGGVTA